MARHRRRRVPARAPRGRFHARQGALSLCARRQRSGLGWHVYTPLETRARATRLGQPRLRARCPARTPAHEPPGRCRARSTLDGLAARVPTPQTAFTPANESARNLWYWPDIHAMLASALPAGPRSPPVPFSIDADAQPATPGGLPTRRRHPPRPAQPPPRICAHVVRLGPDADRCFCRLRGRLSPSAASSTVLPAVHSAQIIETVAIFHRIRGLPAHFAGSCLGRALFGPCLAP